MPNSGSPVRVAVAGGYGVGLTMQVARFPQPGVQMRLAEWLLDDQPGRRVQADRREPDAADLYFAGDSSVATRGGAG